MDPSMKLTFQNILPCSCNRHLVNCWQMPSFLCFLVVVVEWKATAGIPQNAEYSRIRVVSRMGEPRNFFSWNREAGWCKICLSSWCIIIKLSCSADLTYGWDTWLWIQRRIGSTYVQKTFFNEDTMSEKEVGGNKSAVNYLFTTKSFLQEALNKL